MGYSTGSAGGGAGTDAETIQSIPVDAATPTDAQMFIYDGSVDDEWEPKSISGDVTITRDGVATVTADATQITETEHGNVQAAIDNAESRLDAIEGDTGLADHIADGSGAHAASAISFDDGVASLGETDQQGATEALKALIDAIKPPRQIDMYGKVVGGSANWVGPAGTAPMNQDETWTETYGDNGSPPTGNFGRHGFPCPVAGTISRVLAFYEAAVAENIKFALLRIRPNWGTQDAPSEAVPVASTSKTIATVAPYLWKSSASEITIVTAGSANVVQEGDLLVPVFYSANPVTGSTFHMQVDITPS